MSQGAEDCHLSDENSIIDAKEDNVGNDIGKTDLSVAYTPENLKKQKRQIAFKQIQSD